MAVLAVAPLLTMVLYPVTSVALGRRVRSVFSAVLFLSILLRPSRIQAGSALRRGGSTTPTEIGRF